MAKEITIKAEQRQEQGSGAVRRLRRKGLVPAAMNRIAGGSTLMQVSAHEFENMLRHHSSNQLLVTIELDGQSLPALLRAEKLLKKARKAGLLGNDSGVPALHRAAILHSKNPKRAIAENLFALAECAQGKAWSAEELLADEIKRRERRLRKLEASAKFPVEKASRRMRDRALRIGGRHAKRPLTRQ